jgi:multidrug transporter EmrE-like cation transporter
MRATLRPVVTAGQPVHENDLVLRGFGTGSPVVGIGPATLTAHCGQDSEKCSPSYVKASASCKLSSAPPLSLLSSVILPSLSLRALPMGTAYAVWTGIGAAGTAILCVVLLDESASPPRLLCITLILTGVIGLNWFRKSEGWNRSRSLIECAHMAQSGQIDP